MTPQGPGLMHRVNRHDEISDWLVAVCDEMGGPLSQADALDGVAGLCGVSRGTAGTYLAAVLRRGAFRRVWGGGYIWPVLFPPPPPAPRRLRRPVRRGSVIVLAALAVAAPASAAVTQPRAVQLRPLEPRTWTAPMLPAAAHDSTVTVSVRGWAEDVIWEGGCRWRGAAVTGIRGHVTIVHDDCDRWRPRVTMTWVPAPGERTRRLRVSVQAYYDVSKPSQAPEPAPEVEPEMRSEWLACTYDPDGPDGPQEAAPVDVEFAPADTLLLSRRLRAATP